MQLLQLCAFCAPESISRNLFSGLPGTSITPELDLVLRDPIRLAFALLGPMLLMAAFGFGISFDVEDLTYAALDRDRSPERRAYLEQFALD